MTLLENKRLKPHAFRMRLVSYPDQLPTDEAGTQVSSGM
ncbi:hypothetical protein RISK_002496 [Rhodopirellula islandica]|uniref:Uncharacterized protein n=1 Tax=Rhodopirellula islandica TaxID=595434 RepID=A0A0J1EK18_RHOIS|nr:hypothetical protein RISK_002496 [Rhodopirellula islandica]